MGLMKTLRTLRTEGGGGYLIRPSKNAWFFDRNRVKGAVLKVERSVQGAQGALIRGIARRSMRRRKGPSAPGDPPHAHVGYLKDMLYFAWDPTTRTTVVGPAIFKRGIVPSLMEEGGTAVVTRYKHGNWTYAEKKAGRREVTSRVAARFPARPFMGPALAIARGELADGWRDAVVRTG
jgi:hypothetical protein